MQKIKLAVFFLLLCAPLSFALTADQIVARSDKLIRGNSSVSDFSMSVKTPDWERTLKFKGWSKGSDRMLIKIYYPPKEAGTASLKVGADMWNYLPKINRTIKIPPSMMLQSWMGSDFTNDDIVKESSLVKDYTHALKDQEKIGEDSCYKIVNTPKPDAAVVWSKVIYYCRVSDLVPVREEFYGDKGDMVKLMTLSEIKYMHDRNYPTKWKMQTLNRPDHSTVINVNDIKFNVPVPDRTFSLQNLGR